MTRLLREHFGDYVDVGFTAEMEEILDQISNGEKDWLDFIREFYRGDGKHHGLENLVEDKGQEIAYPVIDLGDDPEAGCPIRVRIGRYGPFLQMGDSSSDGPRASLPDDLAPADLTCEKALGAAQGQGAGAAVARRRSRHRPEVYVMHGRFGPTCSSAKHRPTRRRTSRAARRSGATSARTRSRWTRRCGCCRCRASSGPADDGEMIVANVGRFGPVRQARLRVPLARSRTTTSTPITLERAKELLAQEKKSMRRQRAAAKELRALGAHPESGAPVRILDGRYGPYVTDGDDQRLAAEGHGARGADDGRSHGAARSARGRRQARRAVGPRRSRRRRGKSKGRGRGVK